MIVTFLNIPAIYAKLVAVFLTLTLIVTLTSCSVTNTRISSPLIKQTQSERIQALTALSAWQVKGKIAFLEAGNRNSANLAWQVDNNQKNQQLNLTSYLGINVLKLLSNNGLHTVVVEGTTYQSDDLTNLIYSLTGLILPTDALQFWLKGLAYQQSDVIIYNNITGLPEILLSQYQQQTWQIKYQGYQQVEQFSLPTQININQGSLIIKIVINHWSVSPR